jgi:hypothetical protein
MATQLSTLLRSVSADKSTIERLMLLLRTYGAAGVLALARAYLGPVTPRTQMATATEAAGSSDDGAVLALALTKLLYELGELALHNPTLDPAGKQPAFALDDAGRPPALSVTHAIAAVRVLRAHLAADDEPSAPPSPRVLLQAARSERYATTARYSYVAPTATYRVPR